MSLAVEVPQSIKLSLEILDPEVIEELGRHADGQARERYALAGLRLGALALRQARGEIDAAAIRHESERLLTEMQRVLLEHSTKVPGDVAAALRAYLDPASGTLPVRLERLLKSDGDLAAILSAHLGPENSVLARTLAAAVGEHSPLFKLLSPGQAGGLVAAITGIFEGAVEQHRTRLSQELSLDRPESALSRLVRELVDHDGKLRTEFSTSVDAVVRQFSLDEPNSALSRLVREVSRASEAVTQEFSLDLEESSLNRIRRELLAALETLTQSQRDFQSEVRATLEGFRARKDEALRSTVHGREYETFVCEVLGTEAHRLGDVFTVCGASVGRIRNSKVGDATVELGPDSAAPGARIVIEAKAERGYDVERILGELRTARDNRGADVGIFVVARRAAPSTLEPLARFGNDILVAWDDEDPTTDVYLKAAYSLGRALVIAENRGTGEMKADFAVIDAALLEISRKAQSLDEIGAAAQTIQNAGDRIMTRARIVKDSLLKEVDRLMEQMAALRDCATATS